MINKIIFLLVTFMRSGANRTCIFSNLKHNANLCPGYTQQLERLLQAFQKYQSLAYDIQGPKDRGSDIVIKLPSDSGNLSHICFQIKSEEDLRNRDYLKILKAQYFDAERTYSNILDYYILLCCDIEKNIDRVRAVSADFSQDSKVHVIIPEHALTFYKLNQQQMDALIKAKLGSEDVVFRNASELVSDLTPAERALLFFMIYKVIFEEKSAFDLEELSTSRFIREVYEIVPDYEYEWFFIDEEYGDDEEGNDDNKDYDENVVYYDGEPYEIRGFTVEERLLYDLDSLDERFISRETSGEFRVIISYVYPIISLIVDGYVRYEYKNIDLLRYMMGLFMPMKGYYLDFA